MTTPIEGLPPDAASMDVGGASVTLTVDAELYPVQALYGAAYIFIDRCYVLLDREGAQRFRVTLAPKKPGADEAALRAMAGEFVNELLACAWRHQITQDNRAVIEAVTTQALAGALGPPSLDDLQAFDFTEESFEDPLGIAMSWEEKYKKPKPAGDANAGGPAEAAKPPVNDDAPTGAATARPDEPALPPATDDSGEKRA